MYTEIHNNTAKITLKKD